MSCSRRIQAILVPIPLTLSFLFLPPPSLRDTIIPSSNAQGANVILGPSINVHRIARNGRNTEYLSGEEPLIGEVMAAEYVKGVQSMGVAAVPKHYILNSQEEHR